METNDLIRSIQKTFNTQNRWLVLAESCTGGLISSLVTDTPGASSFYLGGVISYANQIKTQILGVPQQTLDTYGAVSKETATEMVLGVRKLISSTQIPPEQIVGLAVTGIAGPGGGTEEKPVGLVYIAIDSLEGLVCHRFQWHGSRQENNIHTARIALKMLLGHINSKAVSE
jgi:PncC family amidohydrolase